MTGLRCRAFFRSHRWACWVLLLSAACFMFPACGPPTDSATDDALKEPEIEMPADGDDASSTAAEPTMEPIQPAEGVDESVELNDEEADSPEP